MKKLFTLLTLVVCSLSASADVTTDNVRASVNRQNPEHIFNVLSRGSNNYWSKETYPTETAKGQFAFFAVEGKEDTYRIYSIDEQKWVSYTKQGGYSDVKDFVTVTTANEADAEYFKFTKGASSSDYASADKSGYIIAPYNTTNVASRYLNWFQGAQNNTNKTVGLYSTSWADAGSVWVLIETTKTVWERLSEALGKAKEYPLGEGLGEYKYMVMTVDLTEDIWTPLLERCTELLENQDDEEEANDKISDLQDGINNLVINQPTEGSFLRFYNKGGNKYMTCNNQGNGKAAYNGQADDTNIFYFDGSSLLAFKTGYYMGASNNFPSNMSAVNAKAPIAFFGSPSFAASYNITFNEAKDRYMYLDGNAGAGSTNGIVNTDNKYTYEIQEVNALPIAINAYGFASVNLPVAIKLGDNTTAWYANTVNDSEVTLFKITGTLPAKTPAILINKEEKNTTVDFEIDTTAETDNTAGETNYPANQFGGTIAAETTTSGNNYVLSGDGIKKFTGTTLKGFRAYLPVAQGQSIRSMVFEGEDVVTAIEAAEGAVPADGKAYDLNGRSVVRANGVVIVNGKTIAIK